jgi:hypothetical protein
MNTAITAMFASVPNPGRSFRGIQSSRTAMLVIAVASPTDNGVRKERPCAKTDQGELPIVD